MKVKVLRQRHPEHDAELLERYRALYEGGEAWRELIDHWLPQHDSELPDRWAARKKFATYTNHVGALCDFFRSHLFSEALALDGVEDEWLSAWVDDVDQAGTSLTDWWGDAFGHAMVGRVAYAWVDLPPRGKFVTLDDQLAAGALDAYLRLLTPEQVIWVERQGGRIRWLLVEDVLEERPDVAAEVETVWRWTYIDEVEIRRWEWRPRPERPTPLDDDEAEELDPIVHGCKRDGVPCVPVVELDLTAGLWAVAKLAEPAIAHMRARNDLSWALHMGANPILIVRSNAALDAPTLGAGYFLRVPGEQDHVWYAEPSGANYAILADDVRALREELYRTVQQLAQAADSSATRTRMSAESKARDWQATEIVLAAYAARVKSAVRQVVELVAAIRGIDTSKLQVTGLEGWHQEDLATELEAMALALDARSLSPTYRREIAKLQATRVLGDRVKQDVLDKIHDEIDQAPADDPTVWAPPRRNSMRPDPEADEGDDANVG